MHSRRCRDLAETAMAALAAAGFDVSRPELPPKEQLQQLLRDEGPKHDLVIVMGGDGTINMTLDVMQEIAKPLGILPAGTANDLARTLGLPMDVAEAVKVIAAGHVKVIDLAEVNGKPYVNAASFGLTTDVTKQLDPDKKRRWGVLAYLIAAWKALRRARGFSIEIDEPAHNGQPERDWRMRSIQVVVGNGRSFGGGMTVDAEATIDDGLMHLYCIKALPWWKVLLLLPALRLGTHASSKHVHNATGSRFAIRTKRPIPISADGEILAETPANFTMRPRALRVFVSSSS
jgi:diacylglycerol kinase (ATP)